MTEWIRVAWSRLRAVSEKRRLDQDFDVELESHLEMLVAENQRLGMSPDEARRAARLALGGIEQTKEMHRDARGLPFLETVLQDLRYGARMIRQNPLFALMITLTLTLGIGLNTSLFSVVATETLRPPVKTDPDTFVEVYHESRAGTIRPRLLTHEEYVAYRDDARTLRRVAAWTDFGPTLSGDNTVQARGQLVTCNFFAVFGLETPLLGRLLLPEECAHIGAVPVAVVSEQFWRNQLGAEPRIVGSTIRLDDQPVTVVGVAPASFDGNWNRTDLWIPYTMQPQFRGPGDLSRRDATWLQVAGRMNAGHKRSQAQSELSTIASRIDRNHPGRVTQVTVKNGSRISSPGFRERGPLVVALITVVLTLVMLIACTNVTLLLLSRASARGREIAVRLSLGASRRRLLRQLLTESLLLTLLPCLASLYLVYWAPPIIYRMLTPIDPNTRNLRPDWMVLCYTMGAAVVAGLAAGLAPALQSLKLNVSAALKGSVGLWGGHGRMRQVLVSAQVAMCLVLLAGAGLFLEALYRVQYMGFGFDPGSVLLAPLPLTSLKYTPDAALGLTRRIEDRVRALNGVKSVSSSVGLPLLGGMSVPVSPPGEDTADVASRRTVVLNHVTPQYFETFGIHLLRGRFFTRAESERTSGTATAVIGRSFGRALWPNEDPLGKQFRCWNETCEVVGVVEDTIEMRGSPFGPLGFYLPLRAQDMTRVQMSVLFEGDVRILSGAVRDVVMQHEPRLRLKPETLAELLERMLVNFRPIVSVVVLLGVLALVLSWIGVYGVVAFSVSRRTHELGIRIALGAKGRDILGLIVRSGVRPILAGVVSGLVLVAVLAPVIGRIRMGLFGVNPLDPRLHLTVALFLLAAAITAMLGPARRAARLDPLESLRHE